MPAAVVLLVALLLAVLVAAEVVALKMRSQTR